VQRFDFGNVMKTTRDFLQVVNVRLSHRL
jgi:hypothetical protein